jgi:hypothetical protein
MINMKVALYAVLILYPLGVVTERSIWLKDLFLEYHLEVCRKQPALSTVVAELSATKDYNFVISSK